MLDGGRRMVVIVDDDEAVRESLQFLLETAGFLVATFASGRECLQALRAEDAGCLVVDQHMPELTGLEFLAELRRRGVRLPALLITGSPSPDLELRAATLDGMKVMGKPPVEDELLRFVERSMQ